MSETDPGAAFEAVLAVHVDDPAVTEGTGFGGSPGLRINGHVFVMLVRGNLVVKLPAATVDALVAGGQGERFVNGTRVMKEWFSSGPERHADWAGLAADARRFVDR